MARISARGGFNLFWGLTISTIVYAIGVIVVARLLSPSEYGIVIVALTAPNLIQIFRDWGMDVATIRYTALYNSKDELVKIRSVVLAVLIFEIILGLGLSAFCFLLSSFLAINVFNRPETLNLIQIGSLSIFAGGLLTSAQSVFIGVERMGLNSITMILQSGLTTGLMTVMVVLGMGAYGAIVGTTAAALIAGVMSIIILLRLYRGLYKSDRNDSLKVIGNVKMMFRFGLPLSLSAIISGFLSQFYRFLIIIYTTDSMIGNYQVALNFVVFVTFFSVPVSTILLPAFSKLSTDEDKTALRNVFKFSVKYGSFLVVPTAAAVMALSEPAVSTIFGGEYSYAPLFLALVSINFFYAAFGYLTVGNLIESQGRTRFNLLLTLITSAIGLPLSLILIPRFGIVGLIAASLVNGIPSLILSLRWAKASFGATVDWVSSIKILLSSAAAAAITAVIVSQLSFSSWIRLVIGGTIFPIIFITASILIETMNKSDADNLREMSKDLGPLYYLLNLILNVIQKVATILRR